ncbi:SOS response-associated peptidase [Parvibaculum sp.]|uniref:SOS response-associated peptidase n=1 Tax=Parvibaculum sp. TaxID=2024848 RepID=UPI001B1F4A3D|nr:SOS response-associated peptidase [Parvibaculum sp.]MBO6633732.1 SOS response-associated peptidase [Parvibaculum sp.]MBO6678488.1 SOS response-associated peptidase [Parvibaculum sp.]MBO6685730.1 SOS response-associated peptidase [Parvibaculum sp.]MBO6906606.1 SOS response-associated peptidase [Parvibaculum sp.]
MCGRYAITLPPKAMRDLFGFLDEPDFPPRYNIAPSQPVPVVIRENDGEGRPRRRFLLVRWGLVPSWAKEMPQSLLINARAETIAEKPSFRGAFRHHRALMPATGFYEWQAVGKGPKQPFFIRRRDGKPFAMAAVFDTWMPSGGSELDSCAIVTTEANETLRPVHHRMPVILDEKDWDLWLDPAATEKELLALLRPAPDDLMEAIPVSTRINRVANDDPSLQERGHVEAEPAPAPRPKKRAEDTRQMGLF